MKMVIISGVCVCVSVWREGCVSAVIFLMDRTCSKEDVRYSRETKYVLKESSKREGKENGKEVNEEYSN